MERVLADIPRSHCVVYLDDLRTHAADYMGSLANLRDVFHAIRRASLLLHPKKCHLFQHETSFLGHVLSAAGVATDLAKVYVIRDWPVPHDVGELQSFLGLASYIASPLHHLTQTGILVE